MALSSARSEPTDNDLEDISQTCPSPLRLYFCPCSDLLRNRHSLIFFKRPSFNICMPTVLRLFRFHCNPGVHHSCDIDKGGAFHLPPSFSFNLQLSIFVFLVRHPDFSEY